jgi:hypothetical protein
LEQWRNNSHHFWLIEGNYHYIHVVDANGCYADNGTYINYDASNNSCYCTLKGTVFVDTNGNCVKDITEKGIANIGIQNSVGGYSYTNTFGEYSIIVPSGSSVLTQIINPVYPPMSCQTFTIAVNAVAGNNCTINNNFADSIIPKVDMKTYLIQQTAARPGFSHIQSLLSINVGTLTENLVASSYANDGQIGAANFINNLYSGTNNKYSNISPFVILPNTSNIETIVYTLPTNIPLGTLLDFKDSVCHDSPITNWVNDNTPWDNIEQKTFTVVGSWDPNFKEVSPKGVGPDGNIYPKDSILTYNVHFQNEGTYYAQNVFVLDTLDADLDWSTFRPIYSSHKSDITISKNGELKYNFKNILLPTKASQPILSNGNFIYTIKPKKGLAAGTQIKNKAAIYFDFNEPVITNTTLNTIAFPTGLPKIGNKFGDLRLYPNPANAILHIEIENATDASAIISIFDMMGRTIDVQTRFTNGKMSINTAAYPAGNYIVKVVCNNKLYHAKFSKQ